MNDSSLLSTTDPRILAALGLCYLIMGYAWARAYRDTNDFAKSVKCYLPTAAVVGLIGWLGCQIDILLVLGLTICGFIAMAVASNHFFYTN